MSKYKKELLEHAEEYCVDLGLDSRLVHIPRTKVQADTLHELQTQCELVYNSSYVVAKKGDIAEPAREQDKAIKAIELLKSHLYAHYVPSELEAIAKLDELKGRLDIDNRLDKPKTVLTAIMISIIQELEDAGFKDTNIHENILPIFSSMIKGE